MKIIMDTLDTNLILASAVTILTFAVIYKQIKAFTYWSSRGIKGPTPFPLFGTNVYLFFRNRVELDQEWADKYGKTYGTYEGYLPVLVTSDRELIKYVNIKQFSAFTDRNNAFIHGDVMKNWTFFTSGDYWSNQRALITPMFTSNKMKSIYSQWMNSSVRKFLTTAIDTRQIAAARQVAGGEERFAIMDDIGKAKCVSKAAIERAVFSKDELMALTLDVIARCFFSINLDTYRDKSSEFYKRAYAFSTFDMVHFLLWSLTPDFIARYLKIDIIPECKFEYFHKLSHKIIKERRGHHSMSGKQNDILQSLIDARIPDEHQNVYTTDDDKEAHYNDQMSIEELDTIQRGLVDKSKSFRKFSEQEIAGQATFFFLAGFETTSSSLSFCIYELGHQQDAQDEVYQELAANISGEREVTIDDLVHLKKLEAFISESLRLYNPITRNTRKVTADEGVTLPTEPPVYLPKGSMFASAGLVCHRDPEYWNEPLKFDMSRFYPENKHKILSGTYHPFGIGPRNCAGMRFALLEIRLLLANLLLNYKVLPGSKSSQYPPNFKRHAFFLQLANTDFRVINRKLTV